MNDQNWVRIKLDKVFVQKQKLVVVFSLVYQSFIHEKTYRKHCKFNYMLWSLYHDQMSCDLVEVKMCKMWSKKTPNNDKAFCNNGPVWMIKMCKSHKYQTLWTIYQANIIQQNNRNNEQSTASIILQRIPSIWKVFFLLLVLCKFESWNLKGIRYTYQSSSPGRRWFGCVCFVFRFGE